jgi:hypothetical protein
VLAVGAGAWRAGLLRLRSSTGVQPAAPSHSVADVRKFAVQIHPPPVSARDTSAARRRLVLATDSALNELIGSGDDSAVSWDPSTGLWDYVPTSEETAAGEGRAPTWWQSALALDAVVRAAMASHSTNPLYQQVIETTYAHNVEKPGTYAPQDFENQYMDDTAWWGIAWVHAARYELQVVHDATDASTYLSLAEDDARYLEAQPKRCGRAAIPFRDGYTPNTITDSEFIDLVAQLGQMRSGHGTLANPTLAAEWTADARQTLAWLESSGLINMRRGGVYRTDNNSCHPVGRAQTYTEGEVADALTQMRLLTHDPTYANQAAVFINRVLQPSHGMLYDGVLQEQCEARTGQCLGHSYNTTVFKGLFDDAVADWTKATHSTVYDSFIAAQAQAVIRNATGLTHGGCASANDCQLSMYWARRVPDGHQPLVPTPGSQTSGLTALVNALRLHQYG